MPEDFALPPSNLKHYFVLWFVGDAMRRVGCYRNLAASDMPVGSGLPANFSELKKVMHYVEGSGSTLQEGFDPLKVNSTISAFALYREVAPQIAADLKVQVVSLKHMKINTLYGKLIKHKDSIDGLVLQKRPRKVQRP